MIAPAQGAPARIHAAPALSAREIRRFAHDAPRRRADAPRRARRSFSEVYAFLAMVILALAEIYSLLSAPSRSSGELATPASPFWAAAPLDPAFAVALLALAAAVTVFTLLRRIGPVLSTRAQLQWWLPLPVERRGLLAPGFALALVATAAGCGVAATLLAAGLFSPASPPALALAAALGLGIGGVLFGVATLAQHLPRVARIADAIAAASAPLALAVLVLAHAVSVGAPGVAVATDIGGVAAPIAAVLLLATAAVVVVLAYRSLGRLGIAQLARSAASAGELWSALLSMTFPTTEPRARARRRPRRGAGGQASVLRRSAHFARVAPAASLVLTQLRVWLRTERQLPTLLGCALAPVALLALPDLNLRWVLVIALAVCVLRAVTVAGSSARLLAENPALGRLLPLSEAATRRLLAVVPAAVLLPWLGLTFALVAAVGAAPSGWSLLALPVTLGLAGAATRSAFRPPADWTAPAIATEAGLIPSGWLTSALHGRLLTAVVLAPALLALALGSPLTPLLGLAQILVSAFACWRGTIA